MKNQFTDINYHRKLIALFLVLLAVLPVPLGFIGYSSNPCGWYNSISDTFYSSSAVLFIGISSVLSFLFFTYKPHSKKERISSLFTAAAFLGTVLFPCMITKECDWNAKTGIFRLPLIFSSRIHNFCVLIICISFLMNAHILLPECNKQKSSFNICFFFIFPVGVIVGLLAITGPKISVLELFSEIIILIAEACAFLLKTENPA